MTEGNRKTVVAGKPNTSTPPQANRASLPSSKSHNDEIVSEGNLTYCLMLFMGAGSLFPYNTMLNAVEFFRLAFPRIPFEYVVPICTNGLSPIVQLLTIRLSTTKSDDGMFDWRIIICFFMCTILVLQIPFVAGSNEGIGWNLFATILCISAAGALTAILQLTLLGLSAKFPARYTQAIISGQGMAGLLCGLIRILTKTAERHSDVHETRATPGGAIPQVEKQGHPDEIGRNALSFFFFSSLLTLLCGVAYIVLTRLDFVKYHLRLQRDVMTLISHNDPENIATTCAKKPAFFLPTSHSFCERSNLSPQERKSSVERMPILPTSSQDTDPAPFGEFPSAPTNTSPKASVFRRLFLDSSTTNPLAPSRLAPSLEAGSDQGLRTTANCHGVALPRIEHRFLSSRTPTQSPEKNNPRKRLKESESWEPAQLSEGNLSVKTPVLLSTPRAPRAPELSERAPPVRPRSKRHQSFRSFLRRSLEEPVMTKVSFDEAIQDSALESSESLPLLTKRAEALSYFSVFSKIRSLFFTVVLLFFTTFLVFPGFITSFRSSYGMQQEWYSLVLLSTFGFFDFVGRSLPMYSLDKSATKGFAPSRLYVPAALRLILVPPIIISSTSVTNDIYALLFVVLLAVTNGYFSSLAMMCAPSMVDSHEKEMSGHIMSLALNLGLLSGSILSVIAVVVIS